MVSGAFSFPVWHLSSLSSRWASAPIAPEAATLLKFRRLLEMDRAQGHRARDETAGAADHHHVPLDPQLVDRLVHIGEDCTLVGWQLSLSGRKREAGTAIFDGKGVLCGRARALWIEPRSPA